MNKGSETAIGALCGTILAVAMAAQGAESVFVAVDLSSWVDPFIGTSFTGHTTPAACVPLGMVQAGPDTICEGKRFWWDYCSGYRYEDRTILGFSQTHLNGTGAIALGDVLLQPFTGKMGTNDCRSAFRKETEKASPGYYAVRLDDFAVDVEVSATEHAAIYRFVYDERGTAKLFVDCMHGLSLYERDNADKMKIEVSQDGSTGLSGAIHRIDWYGFVPRDLAFAIQFDRPFRKAEKFDGRYVLDFGDECRTLGAKIALSAQGGVAGAKRNLDAEMPDWSFDSVKSGARRAWNEIFRRAQIEGAVDQKKNWYTSLYHLYIQPNNMADAGEKPFYSTFSLWDTFRAAQPLYTILSPEKLPAMVDSMLEQGRRTGYLPIWTLWGKENQCMVGVHSVPVIVDWFLKECNVENVKCKVETPTKINPVNPVKKQYWLAAYAQIKDSLTQPHPERWKENWDLYDRYGYFPCDLVLSESASRTLECSFDDWCAGLMAQKLGELGTRNGEQDESLRADAEFFFKRSRNWRNVFDPSIGLARGKDSTGRWREPYNPYRLGHGPGEYNDFTEGNAFQYTWHVLQDPMGLVVAMGGRDKFTERLDSLFEAPSKGEDQGELLDFTGCIGQYVHGNEPSHHVIYFYPQVGHPEKTAERVREVIDKFYLPRPDGLCGNDDCGQMSAWYLFSAMGFYPFNPCGGEYIIGAPQVACAKLKVGSGEFKVVARNLSRENKYVKSVTLNGKLITDWKIRYSDIMRGGELVFEMTSKRNACATLHE